MIRSLLLIALSIAGFATEYNVKEHLFSPVTMFDVSLDDHPIAVVVRQPLSLNTTYYVEDSQGAPIASASTSFLKFGTLAEVEDPDGEKIGTIEENFWIILPWAQYKIRNPEGAVIFIAEMDFFGTEFSVFSPDNPKTVVATIRRPFFHFFRDSWTVHMEDVQLVDPLFLILIAAYQTDKDNRARFWADFQLALGEEFTHYDGRRI